MRNRFLFLMTSSLLLVTNFLFAQDTWVQKANFAGQRTAAIGFSIGSKGYVGTGLDNESNIYQDFWEFDPSTNVWTQKADLSYGPVYSAAAFSVGGKGYVTTGYGSGYFHNDLSQYDPLTNAWTPKAPFPGAARYTAVAFSIADKGYFGTGSQYGTYYNDFWQYDPANDSWTQKSYLPTPGRTNAAGLSINNKGYIGFGMIYYDTRQKDFWQYDPIYDHWTRKADLPSTERYSPTTFTIGNKGYIASGFYYSGVADFWEYNPANDLWTSRTAVGTPGRAQGVGFSIQDKGYFGLGSDGAQMLNDFWEYTPPQSQWTQVPDFPTGVRFGSVGIGIGNKGYVGLGADDVQYRSDWWEYDPVLKFWTQKANFPGTERQAAVVFSIGNKAYVGTGLNGYTVYSDFYEYDTGSNSWTRKADYAGGPRYGAMAFNIANKGYVGCGKDQGLTDGNNDFWQYDPVTDTWTQKASVGSVHRSYGVGFNAGNKGYIGLGFEDYDTRKKDLWEYDTATGNWEQKADLPAVERGLCVGFGIGCKGYVGLGYYYSPLSDFWEFNPATNSWTQKEDNLPRGQAFSFSIGSKGYVGTGYNNTGTLSDVWEFDPHNTDADTTPPVVACPDPQSFCKVLNNQYIIPQLSTSDNCGIKTVAYTISGATLRSGTGNDASGVFNPGISTITWTVTDLSGNTNSCSSTVTIKTSNLTGAAIIPSGPNDFCYELKLTATGIPAGSYNYLWSNSATTQNIYLTNVNPDGNYSVVISDTNGCASKTATYNYQKQNLVNSYTILGLKTVSLGQYNNVEKGSVGATNSNGFIQIDRNSSVASQGSFVKAKNISIAPNSIVPVRIFSPVIAVLPTMQYNTTNVSGLPNNTIPQNTTITLNGNFNNLDIRKNSHVTLNGTVFGDISIGENSVVTFTMPIIDIKNMTINAGSSGYTTLLFTTNSQLRIGNRVIANARTRINPYNKNIVFFMGDMNTDAEKFIVYGTDTRIWANIYIPNGSLLVYGDNFVSNTCYMTGLFIAEQVLTTGKYITWNPHECGGSTQPFMVIQQQEPEQMKAMGTELTVQEIKAIVTPNPTNHNFTLYIQTANKEIAEIDVYDVNGRKVEQLRGAASSAFHFGDRYIAGTYLVMVRQGEKSTTMKVIKQ